MGVETMLPLYRDRADAGAHLASLLRARVPKGTVVAAIPRGGVIVARPIADVLEVPLTLVFVRKIALPRDPELAVGALDADGHATFDTALLRLRPVTLPALTAARAQVRREIERQRRAWSAPELASLLPAESVVLVDDGLATGFTVSAAIAHARRHGAGRVVVAVPYAAALAASRIRTEADELVCPGVDPDFRAVGNAYLDFAPVADEEVRAALQPPQTRPAPT
jgi:putative phosphoribosyl transferase